MMGFLLYIEVYLLFGGFSSLCSLFFRKYLTISRHSRVNFSPSGQNSCIYSFYCVCLVGITYFHQILTQFHSNFKIHGLYIENLMNL